MLNTLLLLSSSLTRVFVLAIGRRCIGRLCSSTLSIRGEMVIEDKRWMLEIGMMVRQP